MGGGKIAGEKEFILRNYRRGIEAGCQCDVEHLAEISAQNYIRIADEIAAQLGRGRILDWGCGYGQMSYLLKNRGCDVVSYDVGEDYDRYFFSEHVKVINGRDRSGLPFPDGEFDAVLSCGVLEHVEDSAASLREIARVLKPGGRFFIYNLPNKHSYIEWLARRRGTACHDRIYTVGQVRAELAGPGLAVLKAKRSGVLPKNLTGLPLPVKDLYNRFQPLVTVLDRALSKFPLINELAGSLEVIAVKRGVK